MKNLMRMICVFFLLIYSGVLAILSGSLDCNFENGLCNWIQVGNDDFNWTRLSGPTPTNGTGPDSDHTSGEGYYVYIDSSEATKGEIAKLISPMKDPGQYCLSFWCYMYGEHVQRLRVLTMKEGTTRLKQVFKITQDQGKSWILIQINVNKTDRFQVVIEGKVRDKDSHGLGDIAIDDILMLSAEVCPADCGDPTPEFGLVHSSGNVNIGSTVQVACVAGYNISGSQSMICLDNGTWSERPVCRPLDCGTPSFDSNVIIRTLEGTTYNNTVMLECEEGFSLLGNDFVTCQSDGNWTPKPACVIVNCGDPTPESGSVNSTIFEYSSVVEVKCIEHYRITGHSTIICQANSTWSDKPMCDQIDSEANTLIAVYIVVPLIVIILVILLTVCIWKKRHANPTKGEDATHVSDTHPIIQSPNETYTACVSKQYTRPQNDNDSMSPEEDYAVLDNDRKGKLEGTENVYHNTFDAECSIRLDTDHLYNHMKNISVPVSDNNYAHVLGNKTEKSFNPNYDIIQGSDKYEAEGSDALRKSENYDHIHIRNQNESVKQGLPMELDEEQELNYDFAKAGGISPIVLELDEYSHLNNANIIKQELSAPYECQYSNIPKSTDKSKNTGQLRKAGYEKPVGNTSHMFDVEKNQNASEDDKYNFVLETGENGDKISKSCNHDYFVLEKIESV